MYYWYIARSTELLLDLDEYMRPTKRKGPWGEFFFRRRVREAITSGVLNVREVYLTRSQTPGHFHAVIRLYRPMPQLKRLVWQLHLGSDLYRGRADLMRYACGIRFPSLLILPEPIPQFYRLWDTKCHCVRKHKTDEQEALGAKCCAVWRKYRGYSPWKLFGPSSKDAERMIPLPLGRVPMENILTKQIPEPETMFCMDCDGVGWVEGGKTLQTTCRTCNGTGRVPA